MLFFISSLKSFTDIIIYESNFMLVEKLPDPSEYQYCKLCYTHRVPTHLLPIGMCAYFCKTAGCSYRTNVEQSI